MTFFSSYTLLGHETGDTLELQIYLRRDKFCDSPNPIYMSTVYVYIGYICQLGIQASDCLKNCIKNRCELLKREEERKKNNNNR